MRKSKSFVPIEIGEKYLNIAHIIVQKDGQKLAGAFSGDISGASQDDIARQISDFVKNARARSPEIINVIPSNFVISKNIEIPSIDKKEIHDIIELQAGRHTPYARDEIVLDYADIGVFHNRYTKILLVIVKKEIVTSRYDIIKKGGFKAGKTVLAAESISRTCFNSLPGKPQKPVVLVHVDSAATDFSVIHAGKMIYLRSIPIGTLHIAARSEETQKAFIDEIKKSLDSYLSENIEAVPVKIYLAGAVSHLAERAVEQIRQATRIDTDLMPYRNIFKIPEDQNGILGKNDVASLLPVLASAAIAEHIDFNLIPEDVKISQELKARAKKMTQAAAFFMVALVIFFAILLTGLFFKKAYLQKLLLSYSKETKESRDLRDISEKTAVVKRFLSQKGQSLGVLTELFRLMPKESYLNRIELKPDKSITVTGTADSMPRVFSMVTDLENSESFKSVKVDFTKSRRINDQEVADFGFTFSVEGIQ
ncbi:MAG: pilus assembly protein PilM [Candidatus Omnitrophica bacterium]|nr:pilus assembly protein PilM [Candidatus Omnitrophota bacterium]